MNIRDAAEQVLACQRIAVTGVSRTARGHGANSVAKRLCERGYEVFNINPNASEIDGQPCSPTLKAVPGGVDAVVIGTRPAHAPGTVPEAADLGVKFVSSEAAAFGRQDGITVIDGAPPFMCWYLTLTGKISRVVP